MLCRRVLVKYSNSPCLLLPLRKSDQQTVGFRREERQGAVLDLYLWQDPLCCQQYVGVVGG